jgi:hypothetical protein
MLADVVEVERSGGGVAAILVVHAAATLLMTGLAWFVAVVHYPLLARVGRSSFTEFHASHTSRTTLVVGPLMCVEALSAAALSFLHIRDAAAAHWSPAWTWIGGLGLAAVWLTTFGVLVPLHGKLARGFDDATHARLVRWNWYRTAAWSVRSVAALAMLAESS